MVKFIFQLILVAIAVVISGIMAVVQPIADALAAPFRRAVDWIKGVWSGVSGWFSNIGRDIGNALSSVKDKITAPFSQAFDFVKGIPGKMVEAVGNVGQLLRDKLGNWDIPGPLGKVKDVIPGWASGGFTGRGGKYEVAGLVHKGEYVVPKEQVNQSTGLPYGAGGGGMHIEIHGNVVNETPEAADAWWRNMNRMGELAEQGVAI